MPDAGELLIVGFVASLLLLVVGSLVLIPVLHWRRRERFRGACRSLGLVQGETGWASSLHGARVEVRWVRYWVAIGARSSARWRTSFRASVNPLLGLGLVAYAPARSGDVPSRVQTWLTQDEPLPPPATPALTALPSLRIFARVPGSAESVLAAAAAAIQPALSRNGDLRIDDSSAEVLDEPYIADAATIRSRLDEVARIAAALSAARPSRVQGTMVEQP